MKLNVKALTLALVLGTVTTTATVRVFAQDEKTEKTQQTEKQDEKKQDEKDEYKKPEPALWGTVQGTNIKLGFAKGWELESKEGDRIVQAATADAFVRITAYVSKHETLDAAYQSLKADLEGHFKGLNLTDPKHNRECHGLKVLDTGGHATQQDGREVEIAVDLIEDEGKIIVVEILASHEHMDKYAAEIILAQESYQKAKPDADKDKEADKVK
jgi:hypothetical protein